MLAHGPMDLAARQSKVESRFLHVRDSTGTGNSSTGIWNFGVLGGFLFSTIEGEFTENHSYIGNFSGGVYGSTGLFPPLDIRLELYYASIGTGFASVADSKRHLNYLILPILLDYQFKPAVSLGLGPYFGFLINAKDEGDDFTEDITDLIARLDVGVKIGVFFHVSKKLDLGVTFNRGFINTQRGGRAGTIKHYNQSIMFTLGLDLFEVSKKNE